MRVDGFAGKGKTILFCLPLFLASACTGGVHKSVGATFTRPLVLSAIHAACPASMVRPIDLRWGGITGGISGYAVGKGPILLVLSEESEPILRAMVGGRLYVDRAVVPLGASSEPGWSALKTTWVSLPSYKGAYLVRGRRLDGNGPIDVGGSPDQGQFVIKPGTPEGNLARTNGGHGYRASPGYLWVKRPGCYGLQIDGAAVSEVVTIEVIPSL